MIRVTDTNEYGMMGDRGKRWPKMVPLPEEDDAALERFRLEYGRYAIQKIALTHADLEALMSGQCIAIGDLEYTTVLYYAEVVGDE